MVIYKNYGNETLGFITHGEYFVTSCRTSSFWRNGLARWSQLVLIFITDEGAGKVRGEPVQITGARQDPAARLSCICFCLCRKSTAFEMWWHMRRNHISSFGRNGRVHLNRQGRQFSLLLAADVYASAVVMLDTPCSEVVCRVLATHSIRQFPLHFLSRASPCAITFQTQSTTTCRL